MARLRGSRSGARSACTVFALPLSYAAPPRCWGARLPGSEHHGATGTLPPPEKLPPFFTKPRLAGRFAPQAAPSSPPLLWGGAALLRRRGERVVVKKRSWAEPVSGTGQPFHPLSLARWRRAICCATAQLSFSVSPPLALLGSPLSSPSLAELRFIGAPRRGRWGGLGEFIGFNARRGVLRLFLRAFSRKEWGRAILPLINGDPVQSRLINRARKHRYAGPPRNRCHRATGKG